MENCKSCKFFVRDRLHMKSGACRVHAPTVIMLQTTQGVMQQGVWPPVTEDAWCGEYKMKVTLNSETSPMSIEGRAE